MPAEVTHIQALNRDQDKMVDEIQWAYRNKRKAQLNKSQVIQMIMDHPAVKAIKPEEFIK